jgi:hypothetical protein
MITGDDIRTAALDVYVWRIPAINDTLSPETTWDFCARIIDHAEDVNELAAALLDLGAAAARALRSEMGLIALSASLLQRAADESRSAEDRLAARLVLAYAAIGLDSHCGEICHCADADVIADLGVGDYEATCDLVNMLDGGEATLIAITDLWLELLPELIVLSVDWLSTLLPVDSSEGN